MPCSSKKQMSVILVFPECPVLWTRKRFAQSCVFGPAIPAIGDDGRLAFPWLFLGEVSVCFTFDGARSYGLFGADCRVMEQNARARLSGAAREMGSDSRCQQSGSFCLECRAFSCSIFSLSRHPVFSVARSAATTTPHHKRPSRKPVAVHCRHARGSCWRRSGWPA